MIKLFVIVCYAVNIKLGMLSLSINHGHDMQSRTDQHAKLLVGALSSSIQRLSCSFPGNILFELKKAIIFVHHSDESKIKQYNNQKIQKLPYVFFIVNKWITGTFYHIMTASDNVIHSNSTKNEVEHFIYASSRKIPKTLITVPWCKHK